MGVYYRIELFTRSDNDTVNPVHMRGYINVYKDGRKFDGFVDDCIAMGWYKDIMPKAKKWNGAARARRSVYGYLGKIGAKMYIGAEAYSIFDQKVYGFVAQDIIKPGRLRAFTDVNDLLDKKYSKEEEVILVVQELSKKEVANVENMFNKLPDSEDLEIRELWQLKDFSPLG